MVSPVNFTLYTDVQTFYTNLTKAITHAQQSITMMYYTFDHGDWALKISRILQEKQASGVAVRLIVDEVGLLVDAPTNAVKNRLLMSEMAAVGIDIALFRPQHRRTTYFNRLHFKLCAIDQTTVFIGGSNIGDEYLQMDDLNLRVDGDIGDSFDLLYNYLVHSNRIPTNSSAINGVSSLHLSSLRAGDVPLLLTLPGSRQDVRRALLGLILDARQSLYIRTWLFLPDREIINALLHQSEQGCEVNILFSDHTRIPLIDAANYIVGQKLLKSGARVWRYTPRYMHAKASWNDQGQILFGSANLDSKALNSNYECSFLLQNQAIAGQLQTKFEADLSTSLAMTAETFSLQPWRRKLFAYVSFLASSWL
jgi:cardiolipin synthase